MSELRFMSAEFLFSLLGILVNDGIRNNLKEKNQLL